MFVAFTIIFLPGYIQGGLADLTVSNGLVCERKGELKAGRKGRYRPRALGNDDRGRRGQERKQYKTGACVTVQDGRLGH